LVELGADNVLKIKCLIVNIMVPFLWSSS
jgi:hypothetical protein